MIHRKLIQKTLLKVLQILRQALLLCCYKPLVESLKTQHVKTNKSEGLFDKGSQRSYVTKRVKDLLKLKGVSKGKICINAFGDTKQKNSILGNVLSKLKNDKNETFEIKALCSNSRRI